MLNTMTTRPEVLEELVGGDEACIVVPSTPTVVRLPFVRLKTVCFRVVSLLMKGESVTEWSSLGGRNTPQVSRVEGTRAWRMKCVSRVPAVLVVETTQPDDAGSAEMREGRTEMSRMGREECIFFL